MSWGTGQPLPGAAHAGMQGSVTVVVESDAHLAAVLASDLVGPGSAVFAPGAPADAAADRRVALVMGYEGSLGEPGGDLVLEDDDTFYLQTQDYGTSAYMSVIGATLVRVMEDGDFEAFLTDADAAFSEGTFPSFVTDPAVQLTDVAALGADLADDGPRTRLYVRADGSISTGPGGLELARIDDGPHLFGAVTERWEKANALSALPCAAALADVVDDGIRVRELAGRPWIGRYLKAIEAVRELRARGESQIRVSGFGGRLAPVPAESPEPVVGCHDVDDAAVPLLLWTDDAAFVRAEGRTFRISRTAGEAVEALLVRGSLDAASAVADRVLLAEVVRTFAAGGVRLVPVSGETAGSGDELAGATR
ncbi:daptide biosynthesis RiPP recognition protein [Streptomyces sp. YJ-C3]